MAGDDHTRQCGTCPNRERLFAAEIRGRVLYLCHACYTWATGMSPDTYVYDVYRMTDRGPRAQSERVEVAIEDRELAKIAMRRHQRQDPFHEYRVVQYLRS